MRRLTWTVVSAAFAIWLVLAIGGGRWALDVARQAAAPAPVTLEQLSGIVLYRELGQRNEASAHQGMWAFEGDEVATSAGSVGSLRAFDGSLVELYPEGRLRVNASRIGRVSPGATQVQFELRAGAIRVSIPQMADKAHTVNIVTPHGAVALVPGEYTIRAGSDATRISVWEGRGAAAVLEDTVEIEAGQKLILPAGAGGYSTTRVLENVLQNADFVGGYGGWEAWEDREPERADVSGRLNVININQPGGPDRALRVTRNSVVDAHNETGLRQVIERDVRGARQILLSARVRVDYASLSGGGYVGSEYPIMVRLRYRDRRGSDQFWTQGFYYANPENRPTALGMLIERGVWVPIELDITHVLGQATSIVSFEVSGSGHTFDASIGDLRLLVD
jgi:hypothetical protein